MNCGLSRRPLYDHFTGLDVGVILNTMASSSSSSSSSADSWNRIWEQSQPALHSIHSSLNQQPSPTPRVTRIGKLDAELLDQELVQVLQDPLNKTISLISV